MTEGCVYTETLQRLRHYGCVRRRPGESKETESSYPVSRPARLGSSHTGFVSRRFPTVDIQVALAATTTGGIAFAP